MSARSPASPEIRSPSGADDRDLGVLTALGHRQHARARAPPQIDAALISAALVAEKINLIFTAAVVRSRAHLGAAMGHPKL